MPVSVLDAGASPRPADVAARLAADGAVVLTGVDVHDDASLLAATALAGRPSPVGNAGVLIFDVTPRPDGTDLSSTGVPFPLHTDSTFLPRPHAAIALGCVEAAGAGGRSCVVTARDACRALDAATIDALSEPAYPFIVRDGERPAHVELLPVLAADDDGTTTLRFRRDAIAMAARAAEMELSSRHVAALDAFGAATDDEAARATFALGRGDVLLVDNLRALHGRTAIGPEERRLMRRVKLDPHPADPDAPPATASADAPARRP